MIETRIETNTSVDNVQTFLLETSLGLKQAAASCYTKDGTEVIPELETTHQLIQQTIVSLENARREASLI